MYNCSVKCSRCHSENPAGARFRMNCGGKLPLICPNCATENPDQAEFCINCGQDLTSASSPNIAPTSDLQPPESRQDALNRFLPKEMAQKLESVRISRVMAGERRVVKILFCDVVGSTAASERLDPEDWTEVINGAFEHMIRPVYDYEGTVARVMGDAVLAFFGAPVAHEDDPQWAVLAAPVGQDISVAIREQSVHTDLTLLGINRVEATGAPAYAERLNGMVDAIGTVMLVHSGDEEELLDSGA